MKVRIVNGDSVKSKSVVDFKDFETFVYRYFRYDKKGIVDLYKKYKKHVIINVNGSKILSIEGE